MKLLFRKVGQRDGVGNIKLSLLGSACLDEDEQQ